MVVAGSVLFSVHICRSGTSTCKNWGSKTSPLIAQSESCLQRQGRDQVQGLCRWENTNRTKILFTSTLTLWHIEQDKDNVKVFFMTRVVRSEDESST
jgi:hypothetical protein